MLDAIKSLLDSGILNEESKNQIQEAWDAKLTEAREQIAGELRSEFANRYEHDKAVMVEALDKMVTETLSQEVVKLQEERAQLVADRAKFVMEMKDKANKFDAFLGENLKKEINEFVTDRKKLQEGLAKLEKFVVRALAEELTEFAEDKKDLINTKVKLVAEAKEKLEALQAQFVGRASKMVKEAVSTTLRAEMTQLKEDIKIARENNFGRRLFEAFATEFSATYLNEHAEIRKFKSEVAAMAAKLEEATKEAELKATLAESKDREIAIIKDSITREKKLNEMLKPLAGDKAAVMASLLESVSTDKIENTFQKYLPAVMNGTSVKSDRKIVNESVKEVTGDRNAKTQDSTEETNIVEIRRLAGLK
jgi:hypothetical protein